MCAENSKLSHRFLEQRDLLLWRAWINNTAFSHVLGIKTPIKSDEAEKWFETRKNNEGNEDLVFEKDGNVRAFGGFTNITPGTRTQTGAFGSQTIWSAYIYMFVYPSLMNLGVRTDAIECLCSYGFKKLGLKKIWLYVDSDDIVARRAYEKCGFRLTYKPPPEDYHGPISYSLDKESWEKDHFLK